MHASGVILAAGRGERFGGGRNKVWAELAGRPLLHYPLRAFARSGAVNEVIVVARPGEERDVDRIAGAVPLPVRVVPGGERRQDSARAGVEAARGEYVLVHDGARPLVSPELIRRVLAAAEAHGAAVPVLPVVDTVRYARGGYLALEPVTRDGLVHIQTPQGGRRELLLVAYTEATLRGLDLPDDAAALLALGQPVAAVPGDPENLKVTRPGDLALAARLLGESD
ncbi:MAG: 2-C-methyl-D-erythritol 4-phosphate cytidylyltransferase [Candidatus Acetothermia bacterium]|jgi:2-C-methyl-D-erythritol 4-phosphate cytidylyltransferase|nr:2-C-methyl-D-erythritol 4-phosphate cytidylyltransferase [Candidatus Acetothermia bacterium]